MTTVTYLWKLSCKSQKNVLVQCLFSARYFYTQLWNSFSKRHLDSETRCLNLCLHSNCSETARENETEMRRPRTHAYELTGSGNSASSQAPQPPSSQFVGLPVFNRPKKKTVTWIWHKQENTRSGLMAVVFLSSQMHCNFISSRY